VRGREWELRGTGLREGLRQEIGDSGCRIRLGFPFLLGQHDEEAIKAFPHHVAIDIDQVTLANGIALKWPTSLSVVVPLK
jgi:hypothetical protein